MGISLAIGCLLHLLCSGCAASVLLLVLGLTALMVLGMVAPGLPDLRAALLPGKSLAYQESSMVLTAVFHAMNGVVVCAKWRDPANGLYLKKILTSSRTATDIGGLLTRIPWSLGKARQE